MTREEVEGKVTTTPHKHIVLELPTGYGKSKCGLLFANRFKPTKMLVVINRTVHKNNWIDEFTKWGFADLLLVTKFVCYKSIMKEANQAYDVVLFDEAHHFTSNVIEAVETMKISHAVFMSATLKLQTKAAFRNLFPDITSIKVTMKEAINSQVLPDPQVLLLPLQLDTVKKCFYFEKNTKAKGKTVTCDYNDTGKYFSSTHLQVVCSQAQFYQHLSKDIEIAKKRAMCVRALEKRWLLLCGQRLKWLSQQKEELLKAIKQALRNERMLIFCNSIEQTSELSENCINSKKSDSANQAVLDQFNRGEINCITSCNMLNEGMNLVNCKVGVYSIFNSSDTMIIQKLGRLLRHSTPVIILPYYVGTREEEILQKMLTNCNPELVKTITLSELCDGSSL